MSAGGAMIVVIDYGMGNSGSVVNMLKRIGEGVVLSSQPADIEKATKLILPGVGSFDNGMANLRRLGLVDALNEKVLGHQTPILGICLGIQLFTEGSDEGTAAGFGWIRGRAHRFSADEIGDTLRIPHMGWNFLRVRKEHPVVAGLESDARFYFVHSYHVRCDDPADILTTTSYGIDFVSSVARGPVVGAQFHPEKSLRWGMNIFRRFVNGSW